MSATPSGSSKKRGAAPKNAELGFEEALAQLESIIERIENGQIGLEQSIAEYERGVALIKRCRHILHGAELRVEELTAQMKADQSGRAGATPNEGEAEDSDAQDGGADEEGDEESPF